ncbi:MAG: DEAD/DEAH box helicase, partial [Kiritimatiellae bacterium]|nr:DEAD/DEAH box helicase [Kiritimatiellia bacterium]
MTFDDLGLSPQILEAIKKMGFETPTPVQAKVIPHLLENEGDIVALAQTGTGKTAAFGLPILNMLTHEKRSPQALILCPTRELCVQIARDITAYAACSPAARIVSVYGGAAIQPQLAALNRGAHIIVATPGRMLDILRRRKADLSGVQRVVLDEADEMLNMGFKEDLEAILKEVPDEANTLLFSATMPKSVSNIARHYMDKPKEITVGQRNAGAETVSHDCYIVHERDRYAALKRIADIYPDTYAIVFCRTRIDTQRIADKLIKDGYNADSLHGDLSQAQRDSVMGKFRTKHLQLLIATDVAARGLDVSDLTHVINYNLPDDLASYTHRSGRTGRAGKSGVSVLLINMREKGKAHRIEKIIGKTFTYRKVPSGQQVCEAQFLSMIERMKSVEVDHDQIEPFLPQVYDALEGMELKDVVKRFVSLEFNNLLDYYRKAEDLNPN